METKEVIKNLAKALINWYDFDSNSNALFVLGVIEECNVLSEVLDENCMTTVVTDVNGISDIEGQFDYIVAVAALEASNNPIEFLKTLNSKLADSGKMLIGTDNRFAIRYFCGDKDIFTNGVFDGIDDYRNVEKRRRQNAKGRGYTKAELVEFLKKANIEHFDFYSVMPVLWRPQMIISHDYIPNEDLEARIFPQYKNPRTLFQNEESLYKQIVANGMLHVLANGFLVECSKRNDLLNAKQITVQGDRSREEAMATILYEDKVCKKALFKEGEEKIEALAKHFDYLSEHHVNMIPYKIDGKEFSMPFINGELLTEHFRNLIRTDKDEFIRQFMKFKDIVEHSSEQVPYEEVNWKHFDPDWKKRREDDPQVDKYKKLSEGTDEDKRNLGVILKRGYVDLVSLNCFFFDGDFLFFDQEFYQENFPANAILLRTIDFIYRDHSDVDMYIPRMQLMEMLNLTEHEMIFRRWFNIFLYKLRNENALVSYHKLTRRENELIKSNRERMNYPQEEYARLFGDIFNNVGSKKVILFGSGIRAKRFIDNYSKNYEIYGILDNNKEAWGTKLDGYPIMNPGVLLELDFPYKVFVCIKYYEDVIAQLREMGIKNVSVYDSDVEYPEPVKYQIEGDNTTAKPYHIGYVAGVFDMFHLGHLNLLRRAKEQCDYLIVGIESDEQVVRNKKTNPMMSFEERQQIVQGCRYVDKAVMIPPDKYETEDAYNMYHFDVQFSGSDYENNAEWLSKQTFLRQHGSDMVFFPYTESVSTTKLKGKIKENNK